MKLLTNEALSTVTYELSVRSIFTDATIEAGATLTIIHIDGAIDTLPTERTITFIREEILWFKVDTLWYYTLSTCSAILTGLGIARVSSVWTREERKVKIGHAYSVKRINHWRLWPSCPSLSPSPSCSGRREQ